MGWRRALWKAKPGTLPLWPDGAPGSEARRDEPEEAAEWWVKNVHAPSLTVFAPPAGRASGTAVVIAPGGGHRALVFNAEGVEPARYLAALGVTAFALKYRLSQEDGSTYSLEKDTGADIRRAMRLVRARASEWALDPDRIGVMGWSAGAELAAMVAYGPAAGDKAADDPVDRASARPNFQIVVYPGEYGIPETVPLDAPPAFFVAANDDTVPAAAITALLAKYRRAGIPVEVHLFAEGGHAFNMGTRSKLVSIRGWPQRWRTGSRIAAFWHAKSPSFRAPMHRRARAAEARRDPQPALLARVVLRGGRSLRAATGPGRLEKAQTAW
jgi:acetyl esterase/lipase